MSREHVLPRWLEHALPGEGPFRFSREPLEPSRAMGRVWDAPGLNMTVKRVCRACNSGWMSLLEERTRPLLTPMIKGEGILLGPEVQHLVSAWVAKTAMVLEYAHKEPRRGFTNAERHSLRKLGSLPQGALVWLAYYRGQKTVWFRQHDLRLDEAVPGKQPKRLRGYVATLMIGHLVFRFWKLPWEDAVEAIHLGDRSQEAIVTIWPQHQQLGVVRHWPPRRGLNDEGLANFAVHLIDDIEAGAS